MPLNSKSQNTQKQIVLTSDIHGIQESWQKDNSNNDIPVNIILANRLKSGIVWVHCATQATKAMTNGWSYWLGSMPITFKPGLNIYRHLTPLGEVQIVSNSSTEKPAITFIPTREIAVGTQVCFDIVYFS